MYSYVFVVGASSRVCACVCVWAVGLLLVLIMCMLAIDGLNVPFIPESSPSRLMVKVGTIFYGYNLFLTLKCS